MPEAIRAGLNRYMEANDLNPAAWCREAGIPHSWLYAYLSGESNSPNLAHIVALADAVHASLDEIIGRRVRPNPALLDAAADVFEAQHGFMTLEDMADAIGLPLSSLVAQVGTVETLAIRSYAARAIRVARHVDVHDVPTRDRLRAYLDYIEVWIGRNLHFYRYVHRISQAPENIGAWRDMLDELTQGLADTVLRGAADLLPMTDDQVLAVAETISSIIRGCTERFGCDGMADCAMRQVDILLSGVLRK